MYIVHNLIYFDWYFLIQANIIDTVEKQIPTSESIIVEECTAMLVVESEDCSSVYRQRTTASSYFVGALLCFEELLFLFVGILIHL